MALIGPGARRKGGAPPPLVVLDGIDVPQVDAGRRPAETGGTAVQLDLAEVLPGETDERGRFERLARAISTVNGVGAVHVRADIGRPEVCVHYDAQALPLSKVLAAARRAGAETASRYLEKRWFVRGMDSPTCGLVIEHILQRTPGVLQASVAYAAERLVIEYDKDRCDLRAIEKRIAALGYELDVAEKGEGCGCSAHKGGGPAQDLNLALLSGGLLAAGYALDVLHAPALAGRACFMLSCLAGGYYAARDGWQSIRQLRPDIHALMVIAALAAGALGAWLEGALLLFLFSLGHALEHRAMDRARKAVDALGKLRPSTARVRRGAEVVEVPVASVQRGDRIVLRPGDRVPLDGVVREGRTGVDQAAITGESVPVEKAAGDDVFAGTLVGDAAIEVEVTRLSNESAIARVVDMVSEAEARKSPTQRFTQALERRFVPLVLLGAPALGAALALQGVPLEEAVLRATSLLVAASPCALAISTPSAVLSAVARAARGGVLVKGGAHLEALASVGHFAFDKTGTLTEGKPRLVAVSPFEGASEADLLGPAAGVEALSSHPIARAVVLGAKERGIAAVEARDLEAVHGKGLRARVGEDAVHLGSLALFAGASVPPALEAEARRLEEEGRTVVVVRRGARWLGALGVADTPRPHAREALVALRALGIERTVMLSGDNLRVAKAVAAQVGVLEAKAPLMPEGKVDALRAMAREGGVAMVGDGVNDAPALAAASVGVAMGGAGSDVALETADVVLMGDDLRRLPFAVSLARASSGVIRQNVLISLGVAAALVIASIAGWVRIGPAVALHEGSTLLVVANALRLLAWREPRHAAPGA